MMEPNDTKNLSILVITSYLVSMFEGLKIEKRKHDCLERGSMVTFFVCFFFDFFFDVDGLKIFSF